MSLSAQDGPESQATPVAAEDEQESESKRRVQAAAMEEDPEIQRRAILETIPETRDAKFSLEFYGSVRLHAINHFDSDSGETDSSFGDGASRIGLRSDWQFKPGWYLFGRAEAGFDVLEQFAPKGSTAEDDGGKIYKRLLFVGIESRNLQAVFGKDWSAYYKIAGMADKFSIFGGQAAGVYNAGTDGGATGTGRADDVLTARVYSNALKTLNLKPFNLNFQYQKNQPIPRVENRKYGHAFGVSTWLETQSEYGIGLAYQRTAIDNLEDPLIRQAGISGDATAFAVGMRTFGDSWYLSLVLTRLENVDTTDRHQYIDGYGAELYMQWQFKDRWWLVAGGNWLDPDDDDPEAGQYSIRYGVLGLRYTFDSFRRMIYVEYRIDNGSTFDGTSRKDEITIGIRWDFSN